MKINYFKKISENLQKRSLDAINVFNKTIESLKSINEESETKKKEIKEKILSMQEEVDTLNIISTNNEKIISKIEKIIS